MPAHPQLMIERQIMSGEISEHDKSSLMANAVLGTRVSNLENVVGGIKTDVANLGTSLQGSHNDLSRQITSLGASMASSGQTDWKTLTGFGVLLLAVIGYSASLAKAPIDAQLARLTSDVGAITRDQVPRSELEEKWRQTDRRGDAINAILQKFRDDLYVPRTKQ